MGSARPDVTAAVRAGGSATGGAIGPVAGSVAADGGSTAAAATGVADRTSGATPFAHATEPGSLPTPPPAPPPVATAVIELAGVGKTYASGSLQVEALRGVDLAIGRGELVAIIGPSGSGKSTLMHILGCLDVPTAGSYTLAGHDVAGLDENQLAEVRNRNIGFVFQQFNLLPYLSAWRNVELPLVYSSIEPAVRRDRALAALAQVGLADRADHKPGELSGGQQQRVAVARALVTEPALILADEPTGNLDSTSTTEVLALLADLHRSGRTIVLITHEHDVAARAERIVQIHDGAISADSSMPDPSVDDAAAAWPGGAVR